MHTALPEIVLESETKELLEHAAQQCHQTLTEFIIATLEQKAGEVLWGHEPLVLSDRDRDKFLEMLENPPAPTEALLKAVERYKKNFDA